MSAQPWATVSDVAELTGKTVTVADLRLAVASLEPLVGLIEAVERTDVSDRDRYWLKCATCWQAVWVAAQPDFLERTDVDSASQDGASASYRPDAHVLAPMARKCIRRLSWRGVRTSTTGSGRAVLNVNSDEYEERLPWRPL